MKKLLLISLLITAAIVHVGAMARTHHPYPITFTEAGFIDGNKSIFPLAGYSQDVEKWMPESSTSQTALLDRATQERHFTRLKAHYFGADAADSSPWNAAYIQKIITSKEAEKVNHQNIENYLSETSNYYGINFRRLSGKWKQRVKSNALITLPDTSAGLAIASGEMLVRALPDIDPVFSDPREAGQGYPFDNAQLSAVRAGTPLYVLATSSDKAWKFVVTPTVIGWTKSAYVASVDNAFVTTWRALAERQLGAYVKEPVSVHDDRLFHFIARPGTLLPLKQNKGRYQVAVPVKREDGSAQIKWLQTQPEDVVAMPWKITPAHIAMLMKSMQGKQYGWGNFHFYNDCSAELRSLLMPFGIFLPRNSAAEAAYGRVVDISPLSPAARLAYLAENGRPFLTLIHINNHIMLYIGNTAFNGQKVPMTYQNVWGLHTKSYDSRSIIGGSVFFPLLLSYPENEDIISLAAKPLFALSFIE